MIVADCTHVMISDRIQLMISDQTQEIMYTPITKLNYNLVNIYATQMMISDCTSGDYI